MIILQLVESEEERNLLECFYNMYRLKMMRVALSILHNHQDAEEAVQQVFLRLCDNTRLLPKEICHKTEGFFVIIVRNISIDLYRRKRKIQEIEYEEEYMGVTDQDQLEEVVLARVSEEKLAELIAQLPAKYSSSLILKYYYNYNSKECARLLGIKDDTFRTRVMRAKNMLRIICNKEGLMG